LIPSFGVIVTAVTSADLDEQAAYRVVKSVFDNLDYMKRLHRALGNLVPGRMMRDDVSAQQLPSIRRAWGEGTVGTAA
jgi:TRAP-type uncharacterized transport system substrate-binding protein